MTTFWKGHGTGNDFVIVDQQDPLTSAQVRWLCHRRFGIGADGTLQALRAGDVEDWNGDPDLCSWIIATLTARSLKCVATVCVSSHAISSRLGA
ncbi:diaminopimelate epimerase [Cutibacterium acnes JCM 18920]|nr:diaminopimelate epimerase [Cutibacterium acnes JCM 18920]